MTIKPLGDKVAVKAAKIEENGGIIVPDSVAPIHGNVGEVVAVGPEASVKVGDKVVFSRFSEEKVTVGPDEYLVLKNESLMAVIED